jgi:chromosome segregation ATPase
LIAGMVATLGLAGCEDDVDVARETPPPVTSGDVQRQVGEAVGAAGEYFGQKKQEFLADSQGELQALEKRVEELKGQTAGATGETQEELSDLRVEVSEKLAAAKAELQNLQQAGADAWDDALGDFRTAMEDLQEAYQKYTGTLNRQQTDRDIAQVQ